MYDLEEFLECAVMNCQIMLVTDSDNYIKTDINHIEAKGKRFTCWDLKDNVLWIFLDEE